jgi:N-methylhydantoinase A
MTWRIGVDIGGTFVDFCALDETTNRLHSLKVLTTPDRPGKEVTEGIDILETLYGIRPSEIASFVHGTTVGINTIIQRQGARLALFTTQGFEDVIELARLRMPEMYSLFCSRPEQLVPRDRVFGIRERILADGSEQVELDLIGLRCAIETARIRRVEGIVVSFLNAYRNPYHEQTAKAVVQREAPDLFVFCSTEIWPVIREYERTTTVILNGYVHPRVANYLSSLETALQRRGVKTAPMVTKSNGGIMHVALGKSDCVSMLLSGPASGVMGAAFLTRQAGISNALTLDIGGTSADVALIIGGEPQYGTSDTIGEFPLHVPSVSVSSIGDGGGSIARVDTFGVLKVGPESAGSLPGPACYCRGGTEPTLTDAMVVGGFLGHTPLAFNSVRIDSTRAEAAIAPIARQLKLTAPEAAEAMIKVAISGMFVEINKLIARYGIDLRDFTLVPFGGAGPMLGCHLAKELGMARVMVPLRPGVISALGALIADVKNDFVRTVFVDVDAVTLPALRAASAELRRQAHHWLRDQQGFRGEAVLSLSADMRYAGQSFEIEVPLEDVWLKKGALQRVLAAFHHRHAAIYDFCDETAAVQIINLRLVVAGATKKPVLAEMALGVNEPARTKTLTVWLDGATCDLPLYLRQHLLRGHCLHGPAVIAQEDTTTIIPGRYAGKIDRFGNLHLTFDQ